MKYFLAGIKGSGMAGLASMLYDMGHEVIGCDDAKYYTFTEEVLKNRNIPVYSNADNLTKEMVFVYTAAIHEDHYALKKARALGCKIYGYYEMIGELTKKYETVCIAGSHGKTTTTAMLGHILDKTIGVNYLIGDGTGHVNLDSNKFVVESCEFDRHFLLYRPKYAIITNIDFDHVDCYKDIDDYRSAFQEFVFHTSSKVIACGDDLEIRKLKGSNIIYYGFNDDNDVVAKNVNLRNDGSDFDVYIHDRFFGHFNLNLFGKHMLLNALACIYVCYLEKIDVSSIISNINNFEGAKRRFSEEKINDVVLVDDYAHHPTRYKR